jgi:hypothetical protein
MAKHTIHRIGSMQAKHILLIFSLGLAIAVAPGWAGQQSSSNPTVKPKNGQASGKKSASSSTANSGSTRSESSGSSLGAGKRDPFKVPDYDTGGGGHTGDSEMINGGASLPPGERGLVISQLVLEGIVREIPENKMIAVVTNETKRAYFLHENQSVYNGVVSKISSDAVYFTENVLDAEGRVTTREVVKRLNTASGEGR